MRPRNDDTASPGISAVRRAAGCARAGRELSELGLQLGWRLLSFSIELVGVFTQVIVFCLVRERVLDVDLVRARPYGSEDVVGLAELEQEPRPPRGVWVAKDGDEAAPVDEGRRPDSRPLRERRGEIDVRHEP